MVFTNSCNNSNEELLFTFENIDFSMNKQLFEYSEYINKKGYTLRYDNSQVLDKQGIKLYYFDGARDSFTYRAFLYFLNEESKGIELCLSLSRDTGYNKRIIDAIREKVEGSALFKNKNVMIDVIKYKETNPKYFEGYQIQLLHRDILKYHIKHR